MVRAQGNRGHIHTQTRGDGWVGDREIARRERERERAGR